MNILLSFFIIEIINNIFCVIPLWNFEASTKNLLSESNSYTYTIYTGSACETNNIQLKKTIIKNGNSISETNSIIINGYTHTTTWEDIESVYCVNSQYIYICPKGKNHMNLYKDNQFYEIKAVGVSDSDNWELQCYYHSSINFMFMGYLNKIKTFYSYKFDNGYGGEWKGSNDFHNGLYDFKWTTSGDSNNDYPMIFLADKGYIKLMGAKVTVKSDMNNLDRSDNYEVNLIDELTYSNAYFTKKENKYQFYYLAYEKIPLILKEVIV